MSTSKNPSEVVLRMRAGDLRLSAASRQDEKGAVTKYRTSSVDLMAMHNGEAKDENSTFWAENPTASLHLNNMEGDIPKNFFEPQEEYLITITKVTTPVNEDQQEG